MNVKMCKKKYLSSSLIGIEKESGLRLWKRNAFIKVSRALVCCAHQRCQTLPTNYFWLKVACNESDESNESGTKQTIYLFLSHFSLSLSLSTFFQIPNFLRACAIFQRIKSVQKWLDTALCITISTLSFSSNLLKSRHFLF